MPASLKEILFAAQKTVAARRQSGARTDLESRAGKHEIGRAHV